MRVEGLSGLLGTIDALGNSLFSGAQVPGLNEHGSPTFMQTPRCSNMGTTLVSV